MSDLVDIILNRSYNIKQQTLNYIKHNPQSVKELEELAFSDKQPEGWRAAWILYYLIENDDKLIKKMSSKAGKIIDLLPKFNSPGQKREFLKVLLLVDIPEKYMGKLINLCFEWILNKNSDVSMKVHSMQIIYNYSFKEPDLLHELRLVLEDAIPYSKVGTVNRIHKLIRQIDKRIVL